MPSEALIDGSMNQRPGKVTLYLSVATTEIDASQLYVPTAPDLWHSEPHSDVVAVTCSSDRLRDLCTEWASAFRPVDLERIRCRLVPAGTVPSPAELMHTESLQQLVDWVDGQWLESILRGNRLLTYFQPIVYTHCPGDVFAYECLVRGVQQDGQIVVPERLFAAARATGKMCELDLAARMTAINAASQRQLSTHVFINFNPRYVDNALEGLDSTMEAAATCRISPDRFVFEVVESDEIVDVGKVMRIVETCRRVGCRVALDDVGAGYNSLNLLAEVKPDFIKLDMDLVRDVECDLYKSRVASKLLELARELDVRTVLEGLETREGLQWAIEHGADFGQGFLFATPQPEPPQPSCRWQVPAEEEDAIDHGPRGDHGPLLAVEMESTRADVSAAIPH